MAAEIVGGDGYDVLDGRASVLTVDGEDCTEPFRRGAELIAAEAVARGVTAAVLQARSPSCGAGAIHDGRFAGRVVPDDGVLTAALQRAGMSVEARRGRMPQ